MTTGSFFSTNWIILLNEVVWHTASCLPSIRQLTGAPFHPATLWSGLEGVMRGWMCSCLAKTTETDISSEFWLIKRVIIFAAACCLYWKSVYDFQYTLSLFFLFFFIFISWRPVTTCNAHFQIACWFPTRAKVMFFFSHFSVPIFHGLQMVIVRLV